MTEENHDYKSQLDMKQNKISDLEKRLKFLMEKNPEMKQKVFAYNYTFIYTYIVRLRISYTMAQMVCPILRMQPKPA